MQTAMCERQELLVDYLYDEISDADREHIFRGTVQRALRFGE